MAFDDNDLQSLLNAGALGTAGAGFFFPPAFIASAVLGGGSVGIEGLNALGFGVTGDPDAQSDRLGLAEYLMGGEMASFEDSLIRREERTGRILDTADKAASVWERGLIERDAQRELDMRTLLRDNVAEFAAISAVRGPSPAELAAALGVM